MASDYEYIDHLKEYMRGRAKGFVEDMGDHYPTELIDLKTNHPDKLIELLADWATPTLRGLEDVAINSAMGRLVVSIRWSKQQARLNHSIL